MKEKEKKKKKPEPKIWYKQKDKLGAIFWDDKVHPECEKLQERKAKTYKPAEW